MKQLILDLFVSIMCHEYVGILLLCSYLDKSVRDEEMSDSLEGNAAMQFYSF